MQQSIHMTKSPTQVLHQKISKYLCNLGTITCFSEHGMIDMCFCSNEANSCQRWLSFHILVLNHCSRTFVFYLLDKLKPKTKTKNQIFSLLTFHLKKRTRKLFSPSKKIFSCPSYSKCIKNRCIFIYANKIFFVFSFSFGFSLSNEQNITHYIARGFS